MKILRASELYAFTQSVSCEGTEECHWCGSPCQKLWLHDEPPPIPFQKNPQLAKKPSRLYVCKGCWLFRRTSVTAHYLDGTFKDRQTPMKNSWWITREKSWVIRPQDYSNLYRILLSPPLQFVLSLIPEGGKNHLQLAEYNDHEEIKATTPLKFTINNVAYAYSVYELEQGIQNGPQGRDPSIHALLNFLGPIPKDLIKPPAEKGRPAKEEPPQIRIVSRESRKSG